MCSAVQYSAVQFGLKTGWMRGRGGMSVSVRSGELRGLTLNLVCLFCILILLFDIRSIFAIHQYWMNGNHKDDSKKGIFQPRPGSTVVSAQESYGKTRGFDSHPWRGIFRPL